MTDLGSATAWLYRRDPALQWHSEGLEMSVVQLACWQLDDLASRALLNGQTTTGGRVVAVGEGRDLLPIGPGKALLVCDGRNQGADRYQQPAGQGVAVDCSGQYCTAGLDGDLARSLLQTGCSLDFRDASFPTGTAFRSLFHDVPVIVWRRSEAGYLVMVERSLADYFFRLLLIAVREFGPEESSITEINDGH